MEYYKNLEIENISYFDDDGISQIEQWKDIPDYKGHYKASNLGRIKSLKKLKDFILKINLSYRGYCYVILYRNSKPEYFLVHRVVAKTFIPNPENKPEVNHKGKDGNKLDNRVCSLEWSTRSENMIHAYETKLQKGRTGKSHHNVKLLEKQVLEIRTIGKNMTQQKIAEIYDTGRRNIGDILTRKIWKHI